MLVVLDANEYILTFGAAKDKSSQGLIRKLPDITGFGDVRIAQTIVDEVMRNLSAEERKAFMRFLLSATEIDEDSIVPFETGNRYEAIGFKPADAFIAAYTEHIGGNFLISENRHFLSRSKELPFNVVTAEGFLRIMKLL